MREFLAWWGEAGHPRTPNIGYLCFVYVDETDELAIEKATPWVIASTREVYENTPRRGGVFTQAEEKVGPRSDEIFRNKTDMDFLLQNNLVFVGFAPDRGQPNPRGRRRGYVQHYHGRVQHRDCGVRKT